MTAPGLARAHAREGARARDGVFSRVCLPGGRGRAGEILRPAYPRWCGTVHAATRGFSVP